MIIIPISTKSKKYNIKIGKGIFNSLSDILTKKKSIIITDSNVFNLYKKKFKNLLPTKNHKFYILKPDETSKSFKNLEKILYECVKFGLKRNDLIVAIGGGVVGDIAGFVASIYMRGISLIHVPTTLLAQIDSSIGGKTGINLKCGKNLIGSFYQPKEVIIDTQFLSTLPPEEIKNAMAEAVKYELITGNTPNYENYEELIEFCCRTKSKFIKKDEKDQGNRIFLNFGHTFAHAIEILNNYKIKHGKAVAIGMCLALKMGFNIGITSKKTYEKGISILNKNGLDYKNDFDIKTLFPIIENDKKNTENDINFIFLKKIGKPVIVKAHKITKFPTGKILPPISKSYLHREIICSNLSGGPIDLAKIMGNDPISDDILTTENCLKKLLKHETKNYICELDCKDSASTLRFLSVIAWALRKKVKFTGSKELLKRPILELTEELKKHDPQKPGQIYNFPGNISSQFISGIMMALPLIGGGEINLTSKLESSGYIDITIEVMAKYGVKIRKIKNGWEVPDENYKKPFLNTLKIQRDWSQAAFFIVAKAIGAKLKITKMNENSKQPDRIIQKLINENIREIDVSQTPDLAPILSVWLALSGGGKIMNAARLRFKETNRLKTICNLLNSIGGKAKIKNDQLIIEKTRKFSGGFVNPYGDHRIAMAAAVAAIQSKEPVYILNPNCVKKSYPNFFEDFEKSNSKISMPIFKIGYYLASF